MKSGAESHGKITEDAATIYHGTPLTPRDALRSVCTGRAMCISFYRPDDVEVVEAISPAIMFRQRCLFILAGGYEARRRMGRDTGLVALLRMAGAKAIRAGAVGDYAGHARCALPAQRQHPAHMAIWSTRSACLAHGWANRASSSPMRPIRSRLLWMDRAEGRIAGLPRSNARGRSSARQSLARPTHASRNCGRVRLPFYQRGQHFARAEWMAL